MFGGSVVYTGCPLPNQGLENAEETLLYFNRPSTCEEMLEKYQQLFNSTRDKMEKVRKIYKKKTFE